MKIAYMSDIHLEFAPEVIESAITNPVEADLLILGGDICVSTRMNEDVHRFFKTCSSNYSDVIYVAGNHEHYHGNFARTYSLLKDRLDIYPNIHVLDNEVFIKDDITFIGGTLWTNMNNQNQLTMKLICQMMNDFSVIKNGDAIFEPHDAIDDHNKMMSLIEKTIDANPTGRYIVVSHHAPSLKSIHKKYQHDYHMNGGFASDLDWIMEKYPQIECWTHGHMHDPHDYTVNKTRVMCNPRGYPMEYRFDEFELKTFDV